MPHTTLFSTKILLLVFSIFLSKELSAQCIATTNSGALAFASNAFQNQNAVSPGTYYTFTATAGRIYSFRTTGGTGWTTPYLTITNTSDGAQVFNNGNGPYYNDNCSGGETAASMDWVPSVGGTYRLHVMTGACGWTGATSSAVLQYREVTPLADAFGSNTWRVYAYNGNDRNLGTNQARFGYYEDANVSINSTDRWDASESPSEATGWTGADEVPIDNHTVVYKRQGFPCGYYSIHVQNQDDDARLYINNTQVWDSPGCCVDKGVVWTGYLDGSSTAEFRVAEGCGGSLLTVAFNYIARIPVVPSASATPSSFCVPGTTQLNAQGLAPGGQWIDYNGTSQLSSEIQYSSVSNTFTMELWVNPTATRTATTQSNSGTVGTSGQRYAIPPSHGSANAGAGISVGTNGISVFEHGNSYLPSTLVWNGTVSGWTHVAVVYNNRIPSLYVNGIHVATGVVSARTTVYPSAGTSHGSYGYYQGAIDNMRIWSTARTQAQIYAEMGRETPSNATGLIAHYTYNGSTTAAAVGTNFASNTGTLSNANYYTYTWSGGPSLPSASTNETQTTGSIASVGMHNYSVVASVGGCSSSATSNVPVTVTDVPSQPSVISGATTICSGSNQTYSVTNVVGVTYSWSYTGTASSIVPSGNTVTLNNITVGGTLTVTPSNGCGNGTARTATIAVNNVPTVAGITAPSALCAGSPLNMTTPSVTANGSALTSQGWQLETGVGTGSYNAVSLPYTTAFADNGKRLRYFATNGCGTTYSNLVVLTVTNVATVSVIIAPSALCAGSPLNMTPPSVTTNGSTVTSQGWQLETGVGTGSYNAISLPYTTVFADNGKRLRYFATNGCGTTYSNLVTLTVNNVPTVAGITAPSALCAGSPLNMTTPSVTANGSALTSQGWQLETGVGTGSYNAVSLPYTTAFSDNGKRLRYFATNGCGTTYGNLVTITVDATSVGGTVSSDQTICHGASANTLTLSGQTGSVTKWQANTGSWTDIPATAGLLSYSPGALTVGVQYRAAVQNGVCPEGNSSPATVTVPGIPTVISTGSNSATCGLASENGWVYFTNGSNHVLAALRDNTGGNDMGGTTVSVTEPGAVPDYNGTGYMQRVTAITPTSNAPSRIRLYFTETQYQALKLSNPNYSAYDYSDLRVTKFPGTGTSPSGTATLITPVSVTVNGFSSGVHHIEFDNTTYSTFFIHFGDDVSPLPVSLSSFEASCENGFVKIDWVTESETNNELFTVSRSADLMNWEEILTRPGGHNSNQPLYYTGYDERPLEGISYYRLTQRDYDGTTETFSPVAVTCYSEGGGNTLMVYPNPINDVYTVRITAAKATKGARLNLSDMNGKTLVREDVDLTEGVNEFSYDRMSLSSGTYILNLITETFTVKPVKVVVR